MADPRTERALKQIISTADIASALMVRLFSLPEEAEERAVTLKEVRTQLEGLVVRGDQLKVLRDLQNHGVIRELSPVPTTDCRGTAYWHFQVLDPARLPDHLKKEYEEHGELKW